MLFLKAEHDFAFTKLKNKLISLFDFYDAIAAEKSILNSYGVVNGDPFVTALSTYFINKIW